jgi:hypothetical protein
MLPWWVSDFRVILGVIVAIISIYKYIIPSLRKIPDLEIRTLECHHCYIEEIKLSRIYVQLYFLNKEEKKKIKINDIRILDVMGVDLLGKVKNIRSDFQPFMLEPLNSDKIKARLNVFDALLSSSNYDINLLIKYDNQTRIISTKSKVMQSLCVQ